MPNDPNSYFQSYERQMRSLAAQYAAGDPQSTRKDPFVLPKYFGKPRLGTSLKTSFNNGALPDPVNYQPSSTFHELFHAPDDDAARRMASHVVLEDPSGQTTKRQLRMPYNAHSTVNEIESAFSGHLLAHMDQLGLKRGEYIVGGSGALFESGIRPRDADVRVSKQGWQRMLGNGHVPTQNKGWESIDVGDVQVWGPGSHGYEQSDAHIKRAVEMHGIPFMDRSDALSMKEKFARPKDLLHIVQAGYAAPKGLRPTLESMGYEYSSGLAVPKHVNLETDSARTLIRPQLWGQHDPYNAHSTVNPIQAAYMMAKSELQKIFGKDVIDSTVKKTASFISTHAVGESLLKSADRFAGSINSAMEDAIRMSPSATRYAQHAAARSEAFSEDGDFGKAWGALHSSLSSALGFDGHDNNGAGPGNMDASRFVLKNVIGPYLLLGLTIAPLAIEVGTKIRHALHKGTAQNIAEEHHNLETPTGRYLKDIMGLPYQSQSRVDPIASARFRPRLSQELTDSNNIVVRGKNTPIAYVNRYALQVLNESLTENALSSAGSYRPIGTLQEDLATLDHWGVDRGEEGYTPRERTMIKELTNSLGKIDTKSDRGHIVVSVMSADQRKQFGEKFGILGQAGLETFGDHKQIQRHELFHAAQYDQGVDLAPLPQGPHSAQVKESLKRYGYNYHIEAPAWLASGGRKDLGLSSQEALDVVWRHADSVMQKNTPESARLVYRSAVPAPKALVRHLSKYTENERAQIRSDIGGSSLLSEENVARFVSKHENLENPTGKFIKQILNLPYKEFSIVDIFKALKFPTLLRKAEPELELNVSRAAKFFSQDTSKSSRFRVLGPQTETHLPYTPVTVAEFRDNRQVGGFRRPIADTPEEDRSSVGSYFTGQNTLIGAGVLPEFQDVHAGIRTALGRDYINVYHGTPSQHLASIGEKGLKALPDHIDPSVNYASSGRSGKNTAAGWLGTYVTSEQDIAQKYAAGITGGLVKDTDSYAAVLKVRAPVKNLVHSENFGVVTRLKGENLVGAHLSVRDTGQFQEFAVLGDIKPGWIDIPTKEEAQTRRNTVLRGSYQTDFTRTGRGYTPRQGDMSEEASVPALQLAKLKKGLASLKSQYRSSQKDTKELYGIYTDAGVTNHFEFTKLQDAILDKPVSERTEKENQILSDLRPHELSISEDKLAGLSSGRRNYARDIRTNLREERERAVPQHVNLENPSGQAMKDRMGLPYRAHSVVDPIASANAAHLNPRQKRIRLADLTQQYKDLNTKVQNGFDIKEHLTPEALVAYTARETGGFQGDPYKPSYHVEVAKFDALEEDRKNLLQVLTDAREIFPASKSTDYMFEPSRRGPEREAFKKTLLANPSGDHARFIIRGRKNPVAYSNSEGMQAIRGEGSYGVSVPNTQHVVQKLRTLEEIHGLSEDERVQKDLYGKFKASGGDANIVFLGPNSTASEIFNTRRHELHHRKQASLGELGLRSNVLYRPAMEESPHFKSLSESLTRRGYPEASHGAEATAHLAHGRSGRVFTSSSEVAALDITYRAANDVMSRKGVEAGKELFSASVPVPKGLVKALASFSQEERDHIKGNIGRTGLGTMFMKFQHENPNETVEGSLGGHLSEGFHSYLKLNNLDGPTEQLRASMKVAGHVNLESPTGKFIKKVLSLPYHEFSTVNPIKAAREFFAKVAKAFRTRLASVEKEVHTPGGEEFPQVRKFVDDIETLYPNLIKKPRAVLRAFYDLQTSAYSYFAKHDNIFVSTLARTLLMAEKVEHVMDHTYKFSPARQISKLFRSAVGAEKRNYAHLALDGIETGAEHIMQRRIVILGGIVIGLTETVFSYLHLYHKFSKIWHKYFRPEKDPEELHSERLERERRKGYRDARRNGEKYDPTLPGRQNRKEEKHENLLEEMLNQINPIAAAGRLAKAIRDPRKHIQSLSMYGAFAALVGVTVLQSKGVITKGLAHGLSSEAPGITSGATRDFYRFFTQGMHNLGPGMKAVTAFGGIVGFVFGRSASARAGSFSNVIATYIADTIGKRVAEKLVATDVGIEWAAKLYNQISLIPKYLDIENKFLKDKFKGAEVTSKQLFAASTARAENRALSASESEALKAAQRIAGQLGMEVGGVVLEGFLLAPLRNILRSVGKRIDQTSGLKRARNLGRGFDRQDKEKKNRTADGDDALRRYLSTFSAPAFSQSDLFTNTDYNTATRTTLLSLRRTEIGRTFLDSMSPFVTKIRRIKAGVRAVFTTKLGGRGKHEDWRIRLTRSYNTPAYSKMDIASNPQYSAAQRLLLLGISRTQNGETMLEDASPAVTRLRRIRAWLDGLRNPRELGAHAVTHAVRKGHHSIGKTMSSVSDKALGKNVSQASTDILHTFSGAVNDTGQAIKDARSSSKKRQGKVKIRSNSRIKDHALDEDMLHNAYSRYINYGHEGDALSYSDQTQ